MNATDRVRDYLDASAARLRSWQDNHLSVEASFAEATEPKGTELKLLASFPPAPREYRGLPLRNGLGGARRS